MDFKRSNLFRIDNIMLSKKYDKHFSLSEARNYIPQLKPVLQKIRTLYIELQEMGFDLQRGDYLPGWHPGTRDAFPAQFHEIIKLAGKISEAGIELRDPEWGMVDFPAMRSTGEEVFLCWKLDEEDIEFWHPLHGGYGTREHMDDF